MSDQHIPGELEQSFLQAWDKLAPILWRHAYYRVSDKDMASDLVSETFTRAWDYLRQTPVKNLRALLYRILHNLIVDFYRQKSTAAVSWESINIENNFMAADYSNNLIEIELNLLKSQLDKLPDEYRTVLLWRYVDDLSISQISQLVGKSVGATYVLIHRALGRLKAVVTN